MNLNDVKRDVTATEQGAWIGKKYGIPIPGMGDLCFKVRGSQNSDWRKLEAKLIAAIPVQQRIAGLAPEARDAITGQCLLDAGVLDWDGLDDGSTPIPYSREQAKLMFVDEPAFSDIRDAALWCANLVGTATAAALETDAKN